MQAPDVSWCMSAGARTTALSGCHGMTGTVPRMREGRPTAGMGQSAGAMTIAGCRAGGPLMARHPHRTACSTRGGRLRRLAPAARTGLGLRQTSRPSRTTPRCSLRRPCPCTSPRRRPGGRRTAVRMSPAAAAAAGSWTPSERRSWRSWTGWRRRRTRCGVLNIRLSCLDAQGVALFKKSPAPVRSGC